ncbi:protein FAM200C-like [Rhinoderma darwinii]|uniref:protein FAM200C-like n=1 Tax=Rhinoderma darwinii TaxID=43563 RepID=UPI003F675C4B
MSSKMRKWSDEYVQYGFTCITERDGSQRPNWMICNAKLSNSSLASAKLREHFLKLHGDGKYKNTTLAEFKVKRARVDEKATLPVLGFVPINKPILKASYEVAYLIAKQGKPHTIGETLIKPAVLKMANIMLGKEAEVKLSQIPLSNDTISDRIEDMSKDILTQVVANLISSPAKFSLQLDETTDVSNLSQLAVFVRYVKDDVMKEDFFYFFVRTELQSCWEESLVLVRYSQSSQSTDAGGGVNIIEAEENLKAFQKKLPLWKRQTENDNFANFPLLDDCVSKIEDVSGIGDISVPAELKQAIATHLDELAKSLDGYFPTRESYPAWVRQPFTFSVGTTHVNDEYLDEIIEIQQVQQQLFRTTTLSTFWCQQMVTYPVIAKKALEIFIPFVTTYLCEQSFSRMLDIKRKKRNRLCCENDMRVALAKVKPRISELVSERQQQKSH